MDKMLKCANNDDIVTFKVDDDGDSVTFMFQSPSEWQSLSFSMYYSRVCFFPVWPLRK
ncbi:hypothetical protein NC651_019874 [Populus alba x Populus x berolinensis]|nr:hypothetical protein NC651_019874 [Populus alba x Populus x berolinensis]